MACALGQAEAGTPVPDVCRNLDISEATFYIWKKKYGELGASEVRRLHQLEEENARLKRVLADLTLDKAKATVYKGRKPALTAERIGQLREKAATGANRTKLGKEFGISWETLYQYIR